MNQDEKLSENRCVSNWNKTHKSQQKVPSMRQVTKEKNTPASKQTAFFFFFFKEELWGACLKTVFEGVTLKIPLSNNLTNDWRIRLEKTDQNICTN